MGFGIVRLGGDDLLERRLGLLEIAVLEKRHSISKVVALEAFPGRVFLPRAALCACDRREYVGTDRRSSLDRRQPFGIQDPLVNLDDHAVLIEEERRREREIPAAVEQVAINDVVNAGHILVWRAGWGKRTFLWSTNNCTAPHRAGVIVTPQLMPAMRRPLEAKSDWRLLKKPHLLDAGRRSWCDQKLSSRKPPRNDRRSHILPVRSGREKSGALRGSISQVSTDDGKGSSF